VRKKQLINLIIALIVILFAYIQSPSKPNLNLNSPTATPLPIHIPTTTATVVRAIDGDTIVICKESPCKEETDKQTVRYIGIDTPETKDPKRVVGCFGQEAYKENKKLVEGKEIIMEKDISETDKYGRLLRYVWINDKDSTDEAVFVNDYLVRQGFAHASTFPPDVKYANKFREAQKEAQQNNRGLWNSCSFLKCHSNREPHNPSS